MLIQLSIRNVVLIEKLDLTFDQGLTVFTGETGAGKSILLDSLALTLGERASSSLIRTGSNQASVTACFEIEKTHPVYQQLQLQGYEISEITDQPLVIRRTISQVAVHAPMLMISLSVLIFYEKLVNYLSKYRDSTRRLV